MINNAILQTEGSIGASIPGGAALCNPFLAAKKDISLREPAVELSPICGLRTARVAPRERVLMVAGLAEMTAANGNLFRKTASTAWDGHSDVEIDLSQTTLIDCAGLGALIAVCNLTRARNGVARLVNPSSAVQQMLELTRTAQLFEIVNAPAAHN